VDANPFRVRPSAQVDDRSEPVPIKLLSARISGVQCGDRSLKCALERGQLLGNATGRGPLVSADSNPRGLKPRLPAEAADVPGIGNFETGHRVLLPAPGVLHRRNISSKSAVARGP
jgi:hypothetical protein